MGCCISCCVFLPPGRCSFNPGDRNLQQSLSDRQIQELPGYRQLTTKSGVDIPTLHLKPREPPTDPLLLIYCHGNAVDLGQVIGMLANYANAFDVHVLGFEYPGYGMTDRETSPSESGCIEAAEAALEYAKSTLNFPASRIILFGQSLGSGPAVDLASRHQCGGLLLFSPLLSAIRTHACGCLACTCRCADYFTSIYKVEKIMCRTLVIHGQRDTVVPFSHGETIHSMLQKPHPPLWILEAGHNDLIEVAEREMNRSIMGFLDACSKDATTMAHSSGADDGYQGKAMPLF